MVVKDKVLVSVGDIESAWEIRETPQRMYESVTMVNMKFLRQRFFPSKMQEGTSVSLILMLATHIHSHIIQKLLESKILDVQI